MPPTLSYQFGPFRLDPGGRVLYRDGERVALTPKALDVLIMLVEARDRPVTKDELLQTVWAGTVVEEGSLASHVSMLRKALGDRLIETLPKRGYRFVGQVADESKPPAGPADERVMLAVLPFEGRGSTAPDVDFGYGMTDEVTTQLARIGSARWGVVAGATASDKPTHRLEGSVRRAGARVRISTRLVRVSDNRPLWAESYERDLQHVLSLQTDIAQTIAREVRARLAPLHTRTFLFTSLVDDAARHDAAAAVVRDAIIRHAGPALRIVDGAFCVAFPDARAAVLAAVDVQRALCAPQSAAIAVRMGLHSGTVEDGEDEAIGGPTLARAARVAAAAQGGQILVTAATVALLDRTEPPGVEWRDRGDHTLRGFVRPERLYQLIVAGLRSEFQPIRTQDAQRTNLPPSLTMFIGCQQALEQIREQLHRSRMVTLVGAGGTGKTRLSLEAAGQPVADFPDGVWLVELAHLSDATLVPGAIAVALGARAEGDTPPLTLIESTLRAQRVLLLLDNCEHVIDAAAQAAQALLRALPRLQLLVTSRQALGIEGETLFRVPSLTLPRADAALAAEVIASEAA